MKKQRFKRIKQGSDRNWTEIGRPKVDENNTVAPYYITNIEIKFYRKYLINSYIDRRENNFILK